jgi:hypothetical protein
MAFPRDAWSFYGKKVSGKVFSTELVLASFPLRRPAALVVPDGTTDVKDTLDEVGVGQKRPGQDRPEVKTLIRHASGAIVLRNATDKIAGLSYLLPFLTPPQVVRYLQVLPGVIGAKSNTRAAPESFLPSHLEPGPERLVKLSLGEQAVFEFIVEWSSGTLTVSPVSAGDAVAPHTLSIKVPSDVSHFPTDVLVHWLPALQMASKYGGDLAGRLLAEHVKTGKICGSPTSLLLQVLALRLEHRSTVVKRIIVPTFSCGNREMKDLVKEQADCTVTVVLGLSEQGASTVHWAELCAPLAILAIGPDHSVTVDAQNLVKLAARDKLSSRCGLQQPALSHRASDAHPKIVEHVTNLVHSVFR